MKLAWEVTRRADDGEVVAAKTKHGYLIERAKSGGGAWSTSWYHRRMVHGKRVSFALGKFPAQAIETANQIGAFMSLQGNTLEQALARFNPRALARPGNFSSLAEVLEVHDAKLSLLGIKPATAKSYWNCLVAILREVEAFEDGVEVESIRGRPDVRSAIWPQYLKKSMSILTPRLLNDYKSATVGIVSPDDEEELVTAQITCDSMIRQGRAIFSADAMDLYREANLALPDLGPFMAVPLYNAKKFFELPSMNAIRSVLSAAPKLRRENIGAYRIFFAAIHCGMRRAEIAGLRMKWIEDGEPAIIKLRTDGKFETKHGHGREITLRPWVLDELRALADNPETYMERGSYAQEASLEALIAWLAGHGITARKPIHELRKLWFCQKVKVDGIPAAQKEGGHKDPKITMSFYADNKLAESLLPYWKQGKLA